MGVDVTRRFGTHGSFRQNPGRVALSADEATVSGHVVLERVQARGEVRFMRARLGGLFSCAHGAFENPGGIALSADGITVNGNAFLSDWYDAKGAVRFEYPTIKGDLHGMLISKACL